MLSSAYESSAHRRQQQQPPPPQEESERNRLRAEQVALMRASARTAEMHRNTINPPMGTYHNALTSINSYAPTGPPNEPPHHHPHQPQQPQFAPLRTSLPLPDLFLAPQAALRSSRHQSSFAPTGLGGGPSRGSGGAGSHSASGSISGMLDLPFLQSENNNQRPALGADAFDAPHSSYQDLFSRQPNPFETRSYRHSQDPAALDSHHFFEPSSQSFRSHGAPARPPQVHHDHHHHQQHHQHHQQHHQQHMSSNFSNDLPQPQHKQQSHPRRLTPPPQLWNGTNDNLNASLSPSDWHGKPDAEWPPPRQSLGHNLAPLLPSKRESADTIHEPHARWNGAVASHVTYKPASSAMSGSPGSMVHSTGARSESESSVSSSPSRYGAAHNLPSPSASSFVTSPPDQDAAPYFPAPSAEVFEWRSSGNDHAPQPQVIGPVPQGIPNYPLPDPNPLPRASKKTTTDHLTCCVSCGDDIAYLVTSSQAEGPPRLTLTCHSCTDPVRMSDAMASKSKRKQGNEQAVMACQACKRTIGLATAGDQPQVSTQRNYMGHDTQNAHHANSRSAAAVNLDIESVCVTCYAKYGFCSECGGGGTYRTGKYRPRELFQAGRRTCSLSHVRVGRSHPVRYTFEAWDLERMDPTLRNLRAEQVAHYFVETATKIVACAQVMEFTVGVKTWEDVQRRRVGSREEIMALIDGTCHSEADGTPPPRRYLGVAWMPVPGPRSKRAETAANNAAASSAVTPPSSNNNSSLSANPPTPTHTIAAILTARYDERTGILEHSYSTCTNNTPKGPALALFQSLWQILPSTPQWTYYLARKQHGLAPKFARQNGIKFRTVAEWRKRGKQITTSMFAKSLLRAEVRDQFEPFVADESDVRSALEALAAQSAVRDRDSADDS
ncbi:hypothetical protein BDZ88DRAFT_415129 [Geranomyces variabilis]|nr:hypothetical protein BDZ88DRAFT_415129 [Geranomyces variabilis]KAJ3141878.1 hypothetical protein HDU90_006227 [Geranomyces variabilis]